MIIEYRQLGNAVASTFKATKTELSNSYYELTLLHVLVCCSCIYSMVLIFEHASIMSMLLHELLRYEQVELPLPYFATDC